MRKGGTRLPLLLGILTLSSGFFGGSPAEGRSSRLIVHPVRPISTRNARLHPGTKPSAPVLPPRSSCRFPHVLVLPSRNGGATGGVGAFGTGLACRIAGSPLPPSVLSYARRRRAADFLQISDARGARDFVTRAQADPLPPDTVRILVLRIDFSSNSVGSRTTGNGLFDLDSTATARAAPIDPPPHDRDYFNAQMEALSRYYHVILGGNLVLVWDIYPKAQDDAYHIGDTGKYGPWVFSNSNPDVFQHAYDLVGDALAAADRDSTIDFRRYLRISDNGGQADTSMSVILFHAGADAQGDVNQDSPWDIPSFNLYNPDGFKVQHDSISVHLVMVVPETASQDGELAAMNGVVTHEFGHQLGFADLYDVLNFVPVVGAFSLMDSGNELYGYIADPADTSEALPVRGMLPAGLDPWHKLVFFPEAVDFPSAPDFQHADQDTFTVHLPATEVTNRVLFQSMNLSEYLLAENRLEDLNHDHQIILKADKKTGVILGPVPDSTAVGDTLGYREYDYLLPGQGVLLWHIDQRAISAGLTYYGGVNVFFGRPGVGVVEGDGIFDIGMDSPEYLGGPYDPYYLGGYQTYGPNTVPSSATNDGTPTGITFFVPDSIGLDMRVQVTTGQSPGNWPLVFSGSPAEEQLVDLDLNGDGVPEVLTVERGKVRDAVVGWDANAAPIINDLGKQGLASLPGPASGGLAAKPDFHWPGGGAPAPLLAVASAGGLSMLDGGGSATAWPGTDPHLLVDSLVTATPVVLDSLVLAGCGDGVIRGIRPVSGHPPDHGVALRCRAASAPVLMIGAGPVDSREAIFWAAADGEVGAFRWDGQRADSASVMFRVRHAGASTRPVALLAGPVGPNGELRFFVEWSDGTLEWRDQAGALLPGWPAQLATNPAGEAILCDIDGDGVLETVAVDQSGLIHVFGWNGVEKIRWPHSIWTEDEAAGAPAQRYGPRAIDVDGDGHPEIVLQRSDGILVAFNSGAQQPVGWPLSFGSDGVCGPELVPAAPGYAPRLLVGDGVILADGTQATALNAVRVAGATAQGAGFFATPGVDQARSRFYTQTPTPSAAPGQDLVAGSVRVYPNPLHGDQVTVRFVLGQPADILLDAYDLTGRRVASLQTRGTPGAGGNEVLWNLAGLSPGLYHVRFQARGSGFDRKVFQKLAIVR